jgi:hypothetical protein
MAGKSPPLIAAASPEKARPIGTSQLPFQPKRISPAAASAATPMMSPTVGSCINVAHALAPALDLYIILLGSMIWVWRWVCWCTTDNAAAIKVLGVCSADQLIDGADRRMGRVEEPIVCLINVWVVAFLDQL